MVHIGGASFVPPVMTHFAHVPNLALHTTSPSSEASCSNHSSASSPTQTRFSSSSTESAESLDEWDAVQAHLAYARRMADHTAEMWQKERLAIEKAKLEGTYTGNMTSRQNGNAKPSPSDIPSKPSTSTSAPSSTDKKGSPHKRFGSLFTSIFSPHDSEPARGRSRRRPQ